MKRKTIILALVFIMTATCMSIPTLAMAADGGNGSGTASAQSQAENSNSENVEQNNGNLTAPQASAKSAGYDAVNVSWSKVADADGYVLYMMNSDSSWKKIGEFNSSAVSYKVTGLKTGRTFSFKVAAFVKTAAQASSTSATGAESSVVTAVPTLGTTAVTGKAVSRTTLKISWTKVAGAQKYQVYSYKANTKKYKKLKTTKKTSYKNSRLKSGKKYTYMVKAVRTDAGMTSTSAATATLSTPKKLTWRTAGFKSTNAYKVMAVARSKVGCAYVSGAAGPNSFDCSGFVYYVNKKAGVSGKSFKRSSAQGEWSQIRQYSIGRSYKNAQPGDIVFISSSGSIGNITHVAFYYGDNKLIHATNPSVGVAITSTAWSGGQSKVVDIVRLPNM